ncbi:MAG: DUF1329 domain-containing protein [Rhodospirillaceae bacterium]|nr:DUF1329 domain-containing protein [Rhodospirillaceae bacterium]
MACFARSLLIFAALCLTLGLSLGPAVAGVTPEEAARLQGVLTPVGAERAGNAAGTIPAWTGEVSLALPGYRSGDVRPDPFADDKVLFSITAANVAQYAAQLPEGAKALFAKFPSYRIDVYPSRRTGVAPQSVYDNVARNALRAEAVPEGLAMGVRGAAGGIPFPIPKSGLEVVWNHLLAFWGPAREAQLSTYVVSAAGTIDLTSAHSEVADFPYYTPGVTPETVGTHYFKTRRILTAPPAKNGEGYLAWQPLNIARDKFAAWRYLPGERRVRRGPSLSYDTPDPDASGFQTLDEYYVFFGGPDRYDWTLVGKREMIVPYNNNRFHALPARDVLTSAHANPNALRYELHRVWVVEGVLAPGKSHIAPRRRLYIDEDTWFAVYSDSWDEDGKLWKFGHGTMYLMPEVPALILGSQFVYDLVLGGYVYSFGFNAGAPAYKVTAPHPASELTPQMLATQPSR